MTSWFKGYVIYAIVFVIALLILADTYLIYLNNRVITFNKSQQEKAEKIKVNTSDVMRSLHLLDLAVRSYAFVNNNHYKKAIEIANADKDAALQQLEASLKTQSYSIDKFYGLRDSIESYVALTRVMIDLIDKNKHQDFIKMLEIDPGYSVWLQYQEFSKEINEYEGEISTQAQLQYDQALNNTYILQIILFLIAVPTLGYTAYYANRTLAISERFRKSEEEKAVILSQQNQLLEKTVHERTREILAQNEEITAQNEEISSHNEKLMEAKKIIEEQNLVIQGKNEELVVEVDRQTQNLKQANSELIEHNNRLEQFAFVISHNLRAPMSRIIGLSSILDFTKEAKEVSDIVGLMMKSTQDLDQIIKDLTEILAIQKISAELMNEIQFDALLDSVTSTLEEDIKKTNARVASDFSKAKSITTIPAYMENIFYNLISNAIKYRHPDRQPLITIRSRELEEYVQIDVEDNGLGIDTETHKENLFGLYKRFHAHVDGRGLGLYLVKTQVTALGGKIEVKSQKGLGSIFSVQIKIANVNHLTG